MAFSVETLTAALLRSGWQCECTRKACGHYGRCPVDLRVEETLPMSDPDVAVPKLV